MTCIVGIESAEGVLIGGDSAGVGGWSLTLRADDKVFTRGAYAFGFTSSYRMGQLLRYTGTLSEPDHWDVDRFMVATFVPEVRTILRDGGWIASKEGRDVGGMFLVGIVGRLYAIDSDFQIARSNDGYNSVGCGSDLALGAMRATRGKPDRERLEIALEAAAHHSAGVAGPFHFVSPA
ncbi:MAG: hypothetical protein ACXV5Q_00795 [Frankiaceae bacterium]